MKTIDQLTEEELEQVLSLRKQITAILEGKPAPAGGAGLAKSGKPKRTMSASAKAKIAAAQKARWAKINSAKKPDKK